jgi:hypothetical protein
MTVVDMLIDGRRTFDRLAMRAATSRADALPRPPAPGGLQSTNPALDGITG